MRGRIAPIFLRHSSGVSSRSSLTPVAKCRTVYPSGEPISIPVRLDFLFMSHSSTFFKFLLFVYSHTAQTSSRQISSSISPPPHHSQPTKPLFLPTSATTTSSTMILSRILISPRQVSGHLSTSASLHRVQQKLTSSR